MHVTSGFIFFLALNYTLRNKGFVHHPMRTHLIKRFVVTPLTQLRKLRQLSTPCYAVNKQNVEMRPISLINILRVSSVSNIQKLKYVSVLNAIISNHLLVLIK